MSYYDTLFWDNFIEILYNAQKFIHQTVHEWTVNALDIRENL